MPVVICRHPEKVYRFEKHPNILNIDLIKGMLSDILNIEEAKRAGADLILKKYELWFESFK
jgi:hypothetical protein